MRIHQDVRRHSALIDGAEQATLELGPGRLGYVHLARGNLHANGVELEAGDALKLKDESRIDLSRGANAEVLVFDLPPG